jgi:hypothetical protein
MLNVSHAIEGEKIMTNKTETILKTTSGLIQYFKSEDDILRHYNRGAKLFIIRDNDNIRELFHKGHTTRVGIIETIPARD